MKIYPDIIQKSPEWHRLRALHFTASEFGPFCLNPRSVQLTKDEIIAKLDELSIPCKRNASKDALLELLPDADDYATTSPGALTAILKKIQAAKVQRYRDTPQEDRSEYEQMMIDLADELEDQKEKQMSYNIAVRRGNALESEARAAYENITGAKVDQVGFVANDIGGFGCSPDGLIWDTSEKPSRSGYHYGIEIKCPLPETHMEYLLKRTLPDEYLYQIHGSMAVTGLDRWDFMSYCPGEAPLILTVMRDDFTDQLEQGLKQLVQERKDIEARLAQIWQDFASKP